LWEAFVRFGPPNFDKEPNRYGAFLKKTLPRPVPIDAFERHVTGTIVLYRKGEHGLLSVVDLATRCERRFFGVGRDWDSIVGTRVLEDVDQVLTYRRAPPGAAVVALLQPSYRNCTFRDWYSDQRDWTTITPLRSSSSIWPLTRELLFVDVAALYAQIRSPVNCSGDDTLVRAYSDVVPIGSWSSVIPGHFTDDGPGALFFARNGESIIVSFPSTAGAIVREMVSLPNGEWNVVGADLNGDSYTDLVLFAQSNPDAFVVLNDRQSRTFRWNHTSFQRQPLFVVPITFSKSNREGVASYDGEEFSVWELFGDSQIKLRVRVPYGGNWDAASSFSAVR
jgi:hypothetical protein